MWGLGVEPSFSRRVASDLNCRTSLQPLYLLTNEVFGGECRANSYTVVTGDSHTLNDNHEVSVLFSCLLVTLLCHVIESIGS